jgi:hypothetical protein
MNTSRCDAKKNHEVQKFRKQKSLTKSLTYICHLILPNNKNYTLQPLTYDLSFPRSIAGRSKKFSTVQSVQTGSGARRASLSMGTGDILPERNAAEAWNHLPLTVGLCEAVLTQGHAYINRCTERSVNLWSECHHGEQKCQLHQTCVDLELQQWSPAWNP